MYYSVDAIEGGTARLMDDEETALYVQTSALPDGTSETDVLFWQDGAWCAAPQETARRKAHAAALLRQVLGLE